MSIRLTNNTRAAARAIKEKVKELELEWELNFSYQRATDPKAKRESNGEWSCDDSGISRTASNPVVAALKIGHNTI